nr:DNA-binding pseudobarrel domain-containing protein [Tanacetum cinerariifolium]
QPRPYLPLPHDFYVRYLRNQMTKDPIVRYAKGGFKWRLKIEKVGDRYSFTDGWLNVVKDADLHYGDMLLFWLVNDSTFKVEFYTMNECEKVLPPRNKEVKLEDEVEDEDGDSNDGPYVDHDDPFFVRLPKKFVGLPGIDREGTIAMKNQDGKEWKLGVRRDKSYWTERNHSGITQPQKLTRRCEVTAILVLYGLPRLKVCVYGMLLHQTETCLFHRIILSIIIHKAVKLHTVHKLDMADANWLNLSICDTLILVVALETLKIDWKYSEVKETLGLSSGKDKLAMIRASGNINHSKKYKAVIIRIDSPGVDALSIDFEDVYEEREMEASHWFQPRASGMMEEPVMGNVPSLLASYLKETESKRRALSLREAMGVDKNPPNNMYPPNNVNPQNKIYPPNNVYHPNNIYPLNNVYPLNNIYPPNNIYPLNNVDLLNNVYPMNNFCPLSNSYNLNSSHSSHQVNPLYSHHPPSQRHLLGAMYYTGYPKRGHMNDEESSSPLTKGIEEFQLSNGLRVPPYVRYNDEKGEPDDFIHAFEGATKMEK